MKTYPRGILFLVASMQCKSWTFSGSGSRGQRHFSHQALSGPVLRDSARLSQRYPPIARYGVFGVSTWPIGCDTPSPFSERFPLGEHAKWRCDTPPQKGYLSDTSAIPYENKANGCDTPLCDTISKGYCAIWGGISHWASKTLIQATPMLSIRPGSLLNFQGSRHFLKRSATYPKF